MKGAVAWTFDTTRGSLSKMAGRDKRLCDWHGPVIASCRRLPRPALAVLRRYLIVCAYGGFPQYLRHFCGTHNSPAGLTTGRQSEVARRRAL